MKKMIKFPSIEQFRTIIATVLRQYNFAGLDENGDAIYDTTKPKPILTFKGTVKLHGTNAGVSFKYGYDNTSEYWVQSRENIITPEKDNAGFAFFVESHKEAFKKFATQIDSLGMFDVRHNIVTIYGEWAGGNIQKGVGISNLPKSFFIFGVKVTPITETEEEARQKPAYWIPSNYLKSPEDNIYNIEDFQTWTMDIDFNMPQLVQNKLSELTLAVEEECPVAKAFGFSGVGEGIVWSTTLNGNVHRFKTKGDKHSNSKVTTLKPVDDEKLNKIITVVNQVTPSWRMEQMLSETFDLINGGEIDVKQLGSYIKAVINDIIKEEMVTLNENGLEPKDIGKYVSETSRKYFFQRLNEVTGIK